MTFRAWSPRGQAETGAERMSRKRKGEERDPAWAAVTAGWGAVAAHPLFAPFCDWRTPSRREDGPVPKDGWAVVDTDGQVFVHPTRRAEPAEWAWVFAHLWLHLGLGHGRTAGAGEQRDAALLAAQEVEVDRFLATLKLGRAPFTVPGSYPGGDPDTLADQWRRTGIPAEFTGLGVAGPVADLVPARISGHQDWEATFAAGVTAAVSAAVDVAGGARSSMYEESRPLGPWELARRWFMANYPLLGAVLGSLTVVADAQLARSWDISIAAVDPTVGELYVNPQAQHTRDEWKFIIAHEALHAALAHHARAGWRDHVLWNVAADFVVNGWLVEMGVGTMPEGLLYDARFAGLGVEAVYDQIAQQARRYRKLATLRGYAAGDLLSEQEGRQAGAVGVDLDELLRRALASGLELHVQEGRGLLPAGLVAEIRARQQPPIPWDVALARWFDEYFPAVERRRSYARPSRRQAATPEIPRPGWVTPEEEVTRRTFGVVLDTSLSMNAELLGKALGAIAAYANARDVPAARVVFCDAAPYDAGYLTVDDVAGRVRVRGRGGTVLQPAINLLDRAEDFPPDAPILVITDGETDVLRVRRPHAYLMPAGKGLPFTPKGPVFRVR